MEPKGAALFTSQGGPTKKRTAGGANGRWAAFQADLTGGIAVA